MCTNAEHGGMASNASWESWQMMQYGMRHRKSYSLKSEKMQSSILGKYQVCLEYLEMFVFIQSQIRKNAARMEKSFGTFGLVEVEVTELHLFMKISIVKDSKLI